MLNLLYLALPLANGIWIKKMIFLREEAEEQDEKCARELESLEKHKHLLESAVNEGLSEAMDELEAVQRE